MTTLDHFWMNSLFPGNSFFCFWILNCSVASVSSFPCSSHTASPVLCPSVQRAGSRVVAAECRLVHPQTAVALQPSPHASPAPAVPPGQQTIPATAAVQLRNRHPRRQSPVRCLPPVAAASPDLNSQFRITSRACSRRLPLSAVNSAAAGSRFAF